MARTRIKELCQARGLTLRQLAEKAGTTSQTIQRLEVGSMTVSLAWLEKIARALSVEESDLIETNRRSEIEIIGSIGEHGLFQPSTKSIFTRLDVPADIAITLKNSFGSYRSGMLFAKRFRKEDIANAHNTDCLVAIMPETILLRRLIRGTGGTWTLVPSDRADIVQYNLTIIWAARIIMAVQYF